MTARLTAEQREEIREALRFLTPCDAADDSPVTLSPRIVRDLARTLSDLDAADAEIERLADERDDQRAYAAEWRENGHRWHRERDEAQKEIGRLRGLLCLDTPWPLPDVLRKLTDAADHLVAAHSCDAHGHEEVREARDSARQIIARIDAALSGQPDGQTPEVAVSEPALSGEGERVVWTETRKGLHFANVNGWFLEATPDRDADGEWEWTASAKHEGVADSEDEAKAEAERAAGVRHDR